MTTFENLKELLNDVVGADASTTAESRFVDNLNCDSLDVLNIINEVEERFNVSIQGDETTYLTVGDLLKAINKAETE
jgi:acyl carrier protein